MYYVILIVIIIALLFVSVYLYYKMVDYEELAKKYMKYTFFLWDENVELMEKISEEEKK